MEYLAFIVYAKPNPPWEFCQSEPLLQDLGSIDWTGVHWAIVGGESGPGARPMDPISG